MSYTFNRTQITLRGLGSAALLIASAVSLTAPAAASTDRSRDGSSAKAAAVVPGPLDLQAATVTQKGLDFVLSLRTSGTISAASISALDGRSLCVELFRTGTGVAVRRLCLKAVGGKPRIVKESLSGAGDPSGARVVSGVSISRPASNRLVATVPATGAGLGIGKFRWQASSVWVDTGDCTAPGCPDRFPGRPATARYVKAIPTGCVATGASVRSNSSRAHRVVAISFDDGPSPYTPQMLTILKRHGAHATFFQVGNQMSGRSALQKQILAQGHMIGNHSWSHSVLSGGGSFASSELSRTKARIASQAGFTPCVFRAPYGAISSSLVGIARAQSMLTIQWDVDPTDWARPGAGAISSRVLAQVRPGSIILMHDAGGERSQSVAATETILSTLSRRGYRVVSVETLLGLKITYG
ncbi:MAG: polysaccharide deacetylase family protein [Solirubrobacterales bacterium]|nr:polysaccharide deacetylase family protein [Solirubrobacterales bacterium]